MLRTLLHYRGRINLVCALLMVPLDLIASLAAGFYLLLPSCLVAFVVGVYEVVELACRWRAALVVLRAFVLSCVRPGWARVFVLL